MRFLIVSLTFISILFSSTVFGKGHLTYGVLMKTLSNPFWGAMEEGVRDGSKEAGVAYYLQAVESDQAAEPQLNVCMTMLERKPDVMITAAINSTILLPCLKKANESGIPVVDLDGNLAHDIAKKAGVSIDSELGKSIRNLEEDDDGVIDTSVDEEEIKNMSAFRDFIEGLNLDDLEKDKPGGF